MRRTLLWMMLCWALPIALHAQRDTHDRELWLGYIGSIRLNEKFSLWQDYHFVPDAFGVARFGLIYKPTTRVQLAGGHAWVLTSTAFTSQLVRGEFRPWGQITAQTRSGERFAGMLRFRYDARFRQRLAGTEVLDEHLFHHRLRFMARVRADIKTFPNGDVLHLNIMDEILFNAGGQIANGLDQNRSYLLLGFTHEQYTILAGYHVRMIPQAMGGMRYNPGLTIWFLHTIDLRGRFRRTPEEAPPLPHGG